MKNIKRTLLGVLSSLLFATGFAKVAEQLDPVSRSAGSLSDTVMSATPDSSSECALY